MTEDRTNNEDLEEAIDLAQQFLAAARRAGVDISTVRRAFGVAVQDLAAGVPMDPEDALAAVAAEVVDIEQFNAENK